MPSFLFICIDKNCFIIDINIIIRDNFNIFLDKNNNNSYHIYIDYKGNLT